VFELKRIAREDLDIGSAIYMSDGVIFDISKHGWQGTDSYSKK